jgi:hypothetical protein
MPQKTVPLITSPSAAIDNLLRFNNLLKKESHPRMIALLSRVQSWYVLIQDGKPMFGPSKFIGYRGLTADTYAELAAKTLDGRKTEGVLAPWREAISPGHPKFAELSTALHALCAKHGLSPNGRARISILHGTADTLDPSEADQINALRILIASLSPEGKSELKRIAF